MGRRIWRETFGADASTTWFLYSDEGLIGEYNQNGNAIREYGWNPGGLWGTDPVWQKDASGIYLAHNDHLFTTDKLTKASDGRVSWTAVREAFGKTSVAADSQMTYLLRFPGQWEDSAGGFSQNWNREHANKTGSYLSINPISISGGINLFAYALAEPLTTFDHLGLICNKANQTGNKFVLAQVTICCLKEIFPGTNPEFVEIWQNSLRPQCLDEKCVKWKDNFFVKIYNNGPLECGETQATTLKNAIFLRSTGLEFESDGGTVVHEFTHVLMQWNTGRLKSEKKYGDESLIWENEAYGFENAYTMKFEECRRSKCSCPNP